MPDALKRTIKRMAGMLLATASSAAVGGEAWYVPGWLRSGTPEGGAWRNFTCLMKT